MAKWTQEELQLANTEQNLYISIPNEHGEMHSKTFIWFVEVNNELYVRGANGINSRWYKAALREKKGRVFFGNVEKDVTFDFLINDQTNLLINSAYANKYDAYIDIMTSNSAIQSSIRLVAGA
ncbi:DUF2255 family protein [Holzapfeliella sp. JNUCC 72]